ncbi:DUF4268 domain-containing protein [Desulfococcaceae bacterium OttesenSCG-928-F15]|nr:DUF4268 domain-containing protein [Desulfococcaceae bacterium OttesenSCG-928-F15]
MDKTLGIFKQLDVRSQWPHEGQDFTPWLAKEENIAELGKALGLELEVEEVERAVGPYSADILAKDSYGKYVVIENQLEKTNHDHLGKAITYASVLNASAVVWIATKFTEQHQRAIEWLNDNIASEEPGFYAVEIELWQIDNSRPAIRFNVVSRPASIKPSIAQADAGDLSDKRLIQLQFWTKFAEELRIQNVIPSPREPKPRYWFDVPLGKTGIFLSNTANTYENKVGVRVYVKHAGQPTAFEQLLEQKDAIEKAMGEPLAWDPNPQALDKVIALEKHLDFSDREAWPEAINWMVQKVAKMRKVFPPYLSKLKKESGTVKNPLENP